MRRRRRSIPVAPLLVPLGMLLAGGLALALLVRGEDGTLQKASWVVGVYGGVVGVLVAALTGWDLVRRWSGRAADGPGPAARPSLDHVAGALADAVREEWRTEARLRGLLDETGAPVLVEACWRSEPDGAADAPPRTGSLLDLADLSRRVRGRRLVIVGRPGSGKSTAAALLVLRLLREWTPREPVPVLLTMASWDPAGESMEDWLCRRIAETHRFLRDRRKYGDDAAGELVRRGRVLPVLDGLDEAPAEWRPKILHAIARSPLELPGLVLTCRTEPYRRARGTGEGARLRAVTTVGIAPTGPREAIAYLRAGSPPETAGQWAAVAEHLAAEPDGPLARVLSSPLMVSMAHQIYLHPAADARELIGHRDQERLERHLLTAYVPAVFPELPAARRGGRGWDGAQARAWLEFLAARMRRLDTNELRWWELPRFAGPVAALLAGLFGGAGAGASLGLAFGLAFGGPVGVAAGVVTAVSVGACCTRSLPVPADVQLRWTQRWREATLSGLIVACTAGGIMGWRKGAVDGILLGAVAAVPIALLYALAVPDATARAVSPRAMRRRDCQGAIVYALAYGIPAVYAGWAVENDLRTGVLLGVLCAVSGGLVYGPLWVIALQGDRIGLISWANYTIARLLLVPRGRLPWRLLEFLDAAHELKVLRQVGGEYQFSHVLLRDALARDRAGGLGERDDRLCRDPDPVG